MQKIVRILKKEILKKLIPGQVVLVFGARRVGKTTLIQEIMSEIKEPIKFINAENFLEGEELKLEKFHLLQLTLANFNYLVIDEAQKVENIGQILKLVVDTIPGLKVLVSGSASFELAKQVGEPLTGRKRTLTLYPIAISELYSGDRVKILEQLDERLIYGSYPSVLRAKGATEKKEELFEIVGSYLFKDILELEKIKNANKIKDLLALLAFQVGSEVSLNELATQLGLHITMVSKYLDLLEKVFVIYRVGAFTRNLRKEISKSSKYYFYDNGIRNTIINNFNGLDLRDDCGSLWENFLMSERIKAHEYNRTFVNRYFWRTYDQKEIDLIEEKDGKLYAFEFKYSEKKKYKKPADFFSNYTNSEFKLINRDNFVDFCL